MTAKKTKKTPAKTEEKLRHIPRPKNYAQLMRRTRDFHGYTFPLPRAQATKQDLSLVRRSQAIKTMWETGNYTAEEIQKIIKRKAIDKAIDRKLSPQQKTAITKQWYGTKHESGLKNVIQEVEKGEAQFIELNHANKRPMLNRMKRTNAGFFLWERNVKATVEGRGKKMMVKIERLPTPDIKGVKKPVTQIFKRKEYFFPFPKGVVIPDYVKYLSDKYKPNSIAIGVMSAHGNASYSNITGLNYVWEAIETLKGRNKSHPFSGVYFYYF